MDIHNPNWFLALTGALLQLKTLGNGTRTEAVYDYNDLTLSHLFQQMAAQISMIVVVPLAKSLETAASYHSSNTGPCSIQEGWRNRHEPFYSVLGAAPRFWAIPELEDNRTALEKIINVKIFLLGFDPDKNNHFWS